MKKIFSLFAAVIVSTCMFAAPSQIPTEQDLAANYDCVNNYVIALYFDEEVCNDLVWAGSYNSWATSDVLSMLHAEPLTGFSGWYVFEVVDTLAEVGQMQGKPVQLKKDGSFDWAYQSGDKDAWIKKGNNACIAEAGYDGEANVTWPAKGAYIYEVAYFKLHNSPCVSIPEHNYTLQLYAPEFCEDLEDYEDSVVVQGDFNGWGQTAMEPKYDTQENMYYEVVVKMEEGKAFKFRSGTDPDWKVQIQKNYASLGNETSPVATKDTTLVFRYDSANYTWAGCAAPTGIYTVTITVPAFCQALVDSAAQVMIVGSFDGWTGTAMTSQGNNVYSYTFEEGTAPGTEYKFHGGKWDYELLTGASGNFSLGAELEVTHDFSSASWKGCEETPIVEVKAAKAAAKKVFVNGQMVIMVGESKYNVLGAEMK